MKKLISFLVLISFLMITSTVNAQKKKDKVVAPPDTMQAYYKKLADHKQVGMKALPFKYVNSLGDSVSLSDFKGKYVVLDLWATWCAPCMNEMPYLEELKITMKNDNVVFVSISMDDNKDAWIKLLLKKRMRGVQLWAGKKDALPAYYYIINDAKKVNDPSSKGLGPYLPVFVIIGKDGTILDNYAPRPSFDDELQTALEKLEGLKKTK